MYPEKPGFFQKKTRKNKQQQTKLHCDASRNNQKNVAHSDRK